MRIRVVQKPTLSDVDGINLDVFEPGLQYDVGSHIGALLLAEGWAEPVVSDEPAVPTPINKLEAAAPTVAPRNVIREFHRPYYDSDIALAAERRPRPRRSHTKAK